MDCPNKYVFITAVWAEVTVHIPTIQQGQSFIHTLKPQNLAHNYDAINIFNLQVFIVLQIQKFTQRTLTFVKILLYVTC
jgi:hypothetical protein